MKINSVTYWKSPPLVSEGKISKLFFIFHRIISIVLQYNPSTSVAERCLSELKSPPLNIHHEQV